MNDSWPTPDARSDEELVKAALSFAGDDDNEEYWAVVRILQHRMAAPLLQRMRELVRMGNERQRQLAVDAVAQGRAQEKSLSGACVELLLDTLETETSPKVLRAICHALGHHKSARAVGPLAAFQSHGDADVRLAVVFGLSGQDDPVAIGTLIALSADADRDVRNWATFGLGSLTTVDAAPVRAALRTRLTDDGEIAGEALVGLALRGDPHVVEPLLAAMNSLSQGHCQTGSLVIEAVDAVRMIAARHPDEVWQPILTSSDGLGQTMA